MDIVQLGLFDSSVEQEVWKPVAGYEGSFEVSSHGQVRSLDKVSPQKSAKGKIYQCSRKGRQLKLELDTKGYFRIHFTSVGIRRSYGVHQLVALAFIGSKPGGNYVVNHKDGNPKNNHVNNLEWVTHKENAQHALATGLTPRGEKCPWAKLTEENIRQIKLLWMNGNKCQKIAQIIGLDRKYVTEILRETRWKHVVVPGFKEYRSQIAPGTELKIQDVLKIKRLFKEGVSMVCIARQVNLPYHTVKSIVYGKSCKHIKLP